MQRIIDAQPENNSFARAVARGGAGQRGGAAGGVTGMMKDEILVELDEQKGLLQLLIEVMGVGMYQISP